MIKPWIEDVLPIFESTFCDLIPGFAMMMKYLVLLSTVFVAYALDVEVTDYECDQDLPITADFEITCGGQSKCTFGTSTATVAGARKYKHFD
jgi:hypothetical protein